MKFYIYTLGCKVNQYESEAISEIFVKNGYVASENSSEADIIIINMEDEKLKPVNNIISQIVYNVKGNNVLTTIVNGKILMEDRKLVEIDEQKIYEECEKIIKRISS